MYDIEIIDSNFKSRRMIMKSGQLKSIDLRGVQDYSVATLAYLPCPDIEKITLGIGLINEPRGLPELVKGVSAVVCFVVSFV